MPTDVIRDPDGYHPVVQFSINADNKVGRLNDIIGMLEKNDVHILAMSIIDTTDSSIIRMIVDYPEEAQELFSAHQLSYVKGELIGVEMESEADLRKVTSALVQAEINIHYIYPFIMRPHDRCGLVISLEDNDLAAETLTRHQIKVLGQNDIAR